MGVGLGISVTWSPWQATLAEPDLLGHLPPLCWKLIRGNSFAHLLRDSSPGLYPQHEAWLDLPTPLKPYLSTGVGTLLGKEVCHSLPNTIAVTVDLVLAGHLSHLSQAEAVTHRLHSRTCPTSQPEDLAGHCPAERCLST